MHFVIKCYNFNFNSWKVLFSSVSKHSFASCFQKQKASSKGYNWMMAVNLMSLLVFNICCSLLKLFSIFQRLMPLVLKELASSSATNRRNAAFCAGELAKNGGESTLKYPFPAHALTLTSLALTHYSSLVFDVLKCVFIVSCRFLETIFYVIVFKLW